MNSSTTMEARPGLRRCLVLVIAVLAAIAGPASAEVSVTNIRASQRPGTMLVDIFYDLAGEPPITISLQASNDGGATYALPVSTTWGETGAIHAGNNRWITWNAGWDWSGQYSAAVKFRITATDTPANFVLIPAGTFMMGNAKDPSESVQGELPSHPVNVGAFYMEKHEVTKAQWDAVHTWALAHGYDFDNAGSGKAPSHPVQNVDWYDCAKWCNARSEKDGMEPCYKLDGVVYRTGQLSMDFDPNAGGYRLPTEAEWEKAARGGAEGKRFPWGDTISHSWANYNAVTYMFPYDLGPDGYHPWYNDGNEPYTSPVGSFPGNGYGLQDMAGNVWQWCGPYVLRGGSWADYAENCRVSRPLDNYPDSLYYPGTVGFRCVHK